MSNSLYEYCVEHKRQSVLEQWDAEQNGDLTPRDLTYGSKKQVWWRCDKGHLYKAEVKGRVRGKGCPVCDGKVILKGVNDLAATHPDIAAQWHPTKNEGRSPYDVAAGAHRRAWWMCEEGHEWDAIVASRTCNGSGCPVCTGRKVLPGYNDLASQFPDIAAQWHPVRNQQVSPQEVTPSSNRKVWWICDLGHEYDSVIAGRTGKGYGCPYCTGRKVFRGFNDLATTEPHIAEEWYQPMNGELTPEMVTKGCHKYVWWRCSEGHVWKAIVSSRTRDRYPCGCPICDGRMGKKRNRYKEHARR